MFILYVIGKVYLFGFIGMLLFLTFLFWSSSNFKLTKDHYVQIMYNTFRWPVVVAIWAYDIAFGKV